MQITGIPVTIRLNAPVIFYTTGLAGRLDVTVGSQGLQQFSLQGLSNVWRLTLPQAELLSRFAVVWPVSVDESHHVVLASASGLHIYTHSSPIEELTARVAGGQPVAFAQHLQSTHTLVTGANTLSLTLTKSELAIVTSAAGIQKIQVSLAPGETVQFELVRPQELVGLLVTPEMLFISTPENSWVQILARDGVALVRLEGSAPTDFFVTGTLLSATHAWMLSFPPTSQSGHLEPVNAGGAGRELTGASGKPFTASFGLTLQNVRRVLERYGSVIDNRSIAEPSRLRKGRAWDANVAPADLPLHVMRSLFQIIVDTATFVIGDMLRSFSTKTLQVIAETAESLVTHVAFSDAQHSHAQFVSRTSPARVTRALRSRSDFLPAYHTHRYIYKTELAETARGLAYHSENAKTLQGQPPETFAQQLHSHSATRARMGALGKRLALKARYYVTTGGAVLEPQVLFAQAEHAHGETYVRRGKVVSRALALREGTTLYGFGPQAVYLANADHEHAEYDLGSIRKKLDTRLESATSTAQGKMVLIRVTGALSGWADRNLTVKVAHLLNVRTPTETLEGYRPLIRRDAVTARFFGSAMDAMASFVSAYLAGQPPVVPILLERIEFSIIDQILSVLGISGTPLTYTTLRIPFHTRHYGYFVTRHVISYPIRGQAMLPFFSPIGKQDPNAFASAATQFASDLRQCYSLLREILKLSPLDNLAKQPSTAYIAGIGGVSPSGVVVYNAGFSYNVLLLIQA